MNRKKELVIVSIFMLISGILHLITGILTIGLLELSVTLIIFTFFFLPLAFILLIQIKRNIFTEKDNAIIMSTTVSFLNILMLITQILINSPQDRYYIYPILIILIGIDVLNFPILFRFKTNMEEMKLNSKVNYFCLVIIRGLGISLVLNSLTWIGWPPDPNIVMIAYVVIFGSLYLMNGYYLFIKKRTQMINIELLILLISSLFIGLLLYFYFPHPNILISVFLFTLLIPLCLYNYKKFEYKKKKQ